MDSNPNGITAIILTPSPGSLGTVLFLNLPQKCDVFATKSHFKFATSFWVALCLSLKKVDSQQARNNVYLSNTEEGAVL